MPTIAQESSSNFSPKDIRQSQEKSEISESELPEFSEEESREGSKSVGNNLAADKEGDITHDDTIESISAHKEYDFLVSGDAGSGKSETFMKAVLIHKMLQEGGIQSEPADTNEMSITHEEIVSELDLSYDPSNWLHSQSDAAYNEERLAKVTLQFGIGMSILIALAVWGVISGVMDPVITLGIIFISIPVIVFSLVLWNSIR